MHQLLAMTPLAVLDTPEQMQFPLVFWLEMVDVAWSIWP
jgi:hypothetical protein